MCSASTQCKCCPNVCIILLLFSCVQFENNPMTETTANTLAFMCRMTKSRICYYSGLLLYCNWVCVWGGEDYNSCTFLEGLTNNLRGYPPPWYLALLWFVVFWEYQRKISTTGTCLHFQGSVSHCLCGWLLSNGWTQGTPSLFSVAQSQLLNDERLKRGWVKSTEDYCTN